MAPREQGHQVRTQEERVRPREVDIPSVPSRFRNLNSIKVAKPGSNVREKADKPRMLELLGKLNARIAELNDGSFVVDDQETPRVEAP